MFMDNFKQPTAQQLLDNKYTLRQVEDMVYHGSLSHKEANRFFKGWVGGKSEFRWNDTLNRPEEFRHDYKGNPLGWFEFEWDEMPVPCHPIGHHSSPSERKG